MSVLDASSEDAVASIFKSIKVNKLGVCFFWASFHEPSSRGGQLDRVLSALSTSFSEVRFSKVEADQHESLAAQYQIHVIPTFLFFTREETNGSVVVLDRVTGVSPRELKKKIKTLSANFAQHTSSNIPALLSYDRVNNGTSEKPKDVEAKQTLGSIVNASHVVLIMDGIPNKPTTERSSKAVMLLKECCFTFGHFDVGNDKNGEVSEALTQICGANDSVPQLFVGGKRIGDEKVMTELHEANALKKLKPIEAKVLGLEDRLKKLIISDKILVFMKGTSSAPECGFSKQLCQLMETNGIKNFGTFNILDDEDVRQGLKRYSNWPTYPQLYVDGKLIGGLDIVKEMVEEEDDLREALGLPTVEERIKSSINKAETMLFMKGCPDEPRCGFSRKAVALLRKVDFTFDYFDIMRDREIREGIKTFSNWPTFPQLYIKGKLIGGLDILQELDEDDELEDLKP